MIGIFAIFVFLIQNSKWLSQVVIHIKKNQIGSVPTIDECCFMSTYVFKSCSQVHDKKSEQKYVEHLTSDFLFQSLYQ